VCNVDQVITGEAASGSSNTAALRPLRILIADDNKPFAETLAWLLRDLGDKVEACYNGFDALEVVRRFRPEIVILDIVMPVMHGYDTCRRLRADAELGDTKIFGLTGYGDALPPDMGKTGLFDRRFVKPLDLPRFMGVLNEIRQGYFRPAT